MMAHDRPRRIPLSTYRLQLHRDFPFDAARQVVAYLARLGVSDCYLSPIFAARPGSTHGYDVTDHNQVNPELGGREEYERLAAEISACRMGVVLDIVPNHMGIDASSNPWWRDVLENGQCSAHARYFDIDWKPLKPELEGRVLLPVLGRQYGHVLSAGELHVAFGEGSFEVHYGSVRLPINPRQIPLILRPGLDRFIAEAGEDPDLHELLSILSALANMPPHTAGTERAIAERRREKTVQRERLQRLTERSAAVRGYIDRSLADINGTPGDHASFNRLHGLLEEQPYRLAYWRTASHEINYRRFFDINDLAGLRQEVPEVFEATHALVAQLLASGEVTGLRIDHPDGLFDPEAYFADLQALARRIWQQPDGHPLYVVAEKILSGDEPLPVEWPVHGTSGYNFLNVLNGLFVDGSAAKRLRRTYARFIGDDARFSDTVYDAKKLMMDTSLASELAVLANTIDQIGERDWRSRDFTVISIRDALSEIVACFPVYRTYVRTDGWTIRDRQIVDQAIEGAGERTPALEPSVFDFVREVLLPRSPEDEPYEPGGPLPEDRRSGYPPSNEDDRQSRLRTSMKLQQYTAPVQAKGVEDTAFYRHNVLLSVNEVGGEPDRLGRTPEEFHAANHHRASQWPWEMLATSTHDTKLGEDVRARINVLSELAEEWSRQASRWRRINQANRTLLDGAARRWSAAPSQMAPDRNDEYRFYQALIGAWPVEQPERPDEAFVTRLLEFMNKSIKESKVHTSWINENRRYDEAVARFVRRTLTGHTARRFLPAMVPFQRRVARIGVVNSLAQVVLKLASPGVPDIYQGCERWNLSLVDPDNRRPVDFEVSRRMLDEVDEVLAEQDAGSRCARVQSLLDDWTDGRVKMLLTAAGLRLRRDRPETFLAGSYLPLDAETTVPADLVAFARVPARGPAVIAIAPRLVARLMGPDLEWPIGQAWKTSRILMPDLLKGRRFMNVVSGRAIPIATGSERAWIFAGQALDVLPGAILVETLETP